MDRADPLDFPFDQYQRYRLTAELLTALNGGRPPSRVLDVGGLSGDERRGWQRPLAEFLPGSAVTVLDRAVPPIAGYVAGDGRRLPFPDRAFFAAVSADVLEHVPGDGRPAFIDELLRVSDRFVILTAPIYRPATVQAERLLLEYVRRLLGAEHRQLREHLDQSLPRTGEVEEAFARRGLPCVHFDSGYLPDWLMLMMIKHQLLSQPDGAHLNTLLDRFLNLSRYETQQRAPGYRQVFVASREPADGDLLRTAVARVVPASPAPAGPDAQDLFHLQLLMGLDLAVTGREVDSRDRRIAELEGEVARLKAAGDDREHRLAVIEFHLDRLRRLLPWRIWKRLRRGGQG